MAMILLSRISMTSIFSSSPAESIKEYFTLKSCIFTTVTFLFVSQRISIPFDNTACLMNTDSKEDFFKVLAVTLRSMPVIEPVNYFFSFVLVVVGV